MLMAGLFVSCKPKKKVPDGKDRPMIVALLIGKSGKLIRDQKTLDLKAGDFLYSSDRIELGAKTTADIQTAAGIVFKLGENSTLDIANAIKLTNGGTYDALELKKGSVFAKIQKMPAGSEFTIRTPSFVAGVRGTEFLVESDESGKSKVAVKEGKVAVSSGDKSSVIESGQTAEAESGSDFTTGSLGKLEEMKIASMSKISSFSPDQWGSIEGSFGGLDSIKDKIPSMDGLKDMLPDGGKLPELPKVNLNVQDYTGGLEEKIKPVISGKVPGVENIQKEAEKAQEKLNELKNKLPF